MNIRISNLKVLTICFLSNNVLNMTCEKYYISINICKAETFKISSCPNPLDTPINNSKILLALN